ncbi:hypothetical protein FA15DRAFT_693703 [Coprinopsis marcescibilis]|uniref:Uncharacterized protein n=1 Tax=Coprinopsis marcescibilis TaxID=230819 RepID=A0A5C3KYZ0_COPMA|nr:hypothetical protein FA15DRAFT_693703 [Coprinopsis marcescibilis]
MRFNALVAASFLFTLVSGLVIPSNTLSGRDTDLEVRQDLLEDSVEIFRREPRRKQNTQWKVPGGGGKPAPRRLSETYTRKDVNKAVKAANTEHKRLQGASKTQIKKSPLKVFNNNKHHSPQKPGAKNAKSLPKMKGPGYEYPLPNKNPKANGAKGPARVIMQERQGKLRLKGVVAHDQKRGPGAPGANDHFRIHGSKPKPTRRRK